MSSISISFDVESARRIARMAGATTELRTAIAQALLDGAELIIGDSKSNMDWKNPTGALEASMDIISQQPYAITFGSKLPYAARREFGFHGVDSLGRLYNDYGAYFLTDAVDADQDDVLESIDEAVDAVLASITR